MKPLQRRTLGIAVVGVAVAVASGLAVAQNAPSEPATDATAATSTGTPPTAGDTAAIATTEPGGASLTKPVVDQSTAVPSSPPPTPVSDEPQPPAAGPVQVVLTIAAWDGASAGVVLAGYAGGIIEDDGRCTATLTRGDQRVTTSSPAYADANKTGCGDLRVPRSELASGSWQAVLDYSSPSHSGTSAPVTVVVP